MIPKRVLKNQAESSQCVFCLIILKTIFNLESFTTSIDVCYMPSKTSFLILGQVWKHYKGNTITDAIDPCLKGRFSEEEAANVLQIGLLCTQASSALRPSMAEVVQMLTNRECEIPKPKQPPFLNASVLSTNDCTGSSISKVSLTRTIINQETIAQAPLSDTQSACPTASPDRSSISEAPEKR